MAKRLADGWRCSELRPLKVLALVPFLISGLFAEAQATYITSVADELKTAGPSHWAILSLSGTAAIELKGPGTTVGNIGISSPGTLSLSSSGNPPVAVIGNVFLDSQASMTHPEQVNGAILSNQDAILDVANTDARNASQTFALLTPTLSVAGSQITGAMTVTGGAGVNVLNITKLNLSKDTLTLNAPAGAQFVINDSGDFILSSGVINLSGGLTPADVVFNVTGTGKTVSASGGSMTKDLSVVNGIILAPLRSVQFSPGMVNGELIADADSIQFGSGAFVNGVRGVPEPSSVLLLVSGVIVGGLACYRRRRKNVEQLTSRRNSSDTWRVRSRFN